MFIVLVQLLQTLPFSVIRTLMPGGGAAVSEEIKDTKKKKWTKLDFILCQKPESSEAKWSQVILTELCVQR